MIRHCILIALLNILPAKHILAANIDTVQTFSSCMKKNIKAVIITPEQYATATALPVIYLLHGYSGNYANWITNVPSLAAYADEFNLIIVCPDGACGSWYFDSPVDSTMRYETYIAKELVNWTDQHYKTIANRNGRGITGLSMGGHGALYLAFKHPDIFGAAGSMSGGVDIRPFPLNWDIADRLGSYARYPERWNQHTVINLTHLITPNTLAIMIDCGTEDFFYEVNKALHEKLLMNNIPHDFISRPGQHDWKYWANAVAYQLMFMHNYFKKTPQ